MKILICTDGSSGSVQSAEFIAKLGFPADTPITVLGVREHMRDLPNLNTSIGLIDKSLGKSYKLDKVIRKGNPIEEILSEALETPYDLVALGGGGKQLGLLRPNLGSTARKLVRQLHTHFLVIRNLPQKISKILVCAGSDSPSRTTMELAGKWIANTSAQVGLIHVLRKNIASQVKRSNTDNESKETLSLTDENTDPILTQAVQQLRAAGVNNDISTIMRHGLIVAEVLKELSDGNYDLLVVGAHYQPGQDRWQETLLDDVTDQLLSHSTCSVLII